MDLDAVSDVLSCEGGVFSCFNGKVSRPNSVSHLKRTPIFVWCVVGCGC